MAIEFGKTTARVDGRCDAEDVPTLVEWLHGRKRPRINLSGCTHVHTAVLQALMAARVEVSKAPSDPALSQFVHAALSPRRAAKSSNP